MFNDGVEIIDLVELLLGEVLLNLLDGLSPRGVECVEDSISDCAMLYAPLWESATSGTSATTLVTGRFL